MIWIQPGFTSGLVSAFDFPSCKRFLDILIAIFAPWWPAGRAAGMLYNNHPWRYMVIMVVLFYSWVLLEILQIVETGLAYVGWVVLCGFFAYLVGIRFAIREHSGIQSSVVTDAIIVILFYPLAVDQMYRHMMIEEENKKNDPDVGSFLMTSADKVELSENTVPELKE